jgi:hypothetical protein
LEGGRPDVTLLRDGSGLVVGPSAGRASMLDAAGTNLILNGDVLVLIYVIIFIVYGL